MSTPLFLNSNSNTVVSVGGKTAIGCGFAVPTSGAVGYWPGALFINLKDGKYYKNTGTVTSASWTEQTT